MASFTDSPEALGRFNPYIQQLPIEAMREVGMYKQSLYDQGVQRIQQQIDNIAGLDIIRDVDKKYLQTKLNDLGQKLNIVAAGDFSNYQLTNSVGGMVNKIGKDGNVQNAVYSTANHKKQMKSMETAKEKGEFAPENEWDYQTRFSKYYNSEIAGERFDGQYSPYVDVNKKILAIGKEVGIDETTMQLLWQTDENGNISKDKNGNPIWNPVMAEKHLKGKDASKLLNAFKASLTAADYNQLSITGRYLRAGLKPEELITEVSEEYNKNISAMDSKLHDVEVRLAMENSANVKNYINIKSLEDQRDALKEYRTSLTTARDRDVQSVNNDPERVKGSMYINNYVAGMATALPSLTEETTYKINPHAEWDMKLNEFNHKVNVDAANLTMRQREFNLKVREQDWKEKTEGGLNPLDRGIDQPVSGLGKDATKKARVADFSQKMNTMHNINLEIAEEIYRNIEGNEGKSTETIRQELAKEAKSKYPDNPEQYYIDMAAEATKPDAPKSNLNMQSLINDKLKLQQELDFDKSEMEEIRKEALDRAKDRKLKIPTEQEIKAALPSETPISYRDPETGNETHHRLTPTDLMSIVFATKSQVFGSNEELSRREEAIKYLQYRFGGQWENVIKKVNESEYLGGYNPYSAAMGAPARSIYTPGSYKDAYNNAKNLIDKSDYEQLDEIESEIYNERGQTALERRYPVIFGKDEQSRLNKISEIQNLLRGRGKEAFYGEDFETVSSAVAETDATYGLYVIPGSSSSVADQYKLEITSGGKVYTVDIDENIFEKIADAEAPQRAYVPLAIKKVNSKKTTGTDGSNNYAGAYYSENDFKQIPDTYPYKVKGNLVQYVGDPNAVILRLYLYDLQSKKEFSIEYPMLFPKDVDVDIIPSIVTPAQIDEIINPK